MRANRVGLSDPKYRFLFGPRGFLIDRRDLDELTRLAKISTTFLKNADEFYQHEMARGNSHLASILQHGIPRKYVPLTLKEGLPQTFMIDTMWTANGWRIVEIDATNRNGLGYPLVMRHLYNLPNVWKGNDRQWQEAGFGETIQVMTHHCRFYEPYYRYFLEAIKGNLITETEINNRLPEIQAASSLLDMPIFHQGSFVESLLQVAKVALIGIPPKHHLSSKAILSLPWEVKEFFADGVCEFLPETRLLRNSTPFPVDEFFVKFLQSGGAHGTFYNDQIQFERLRNKRPRAIWQNALPITKRLIEFLDEDNILKVSESFIRLSIYVTPQGEIVDADVTASNEIIVHGGNRSIMTVPTL
ncbi:MAG TPA: hypothetical protein VI432_00045 [Candidatus Paceibacterota bacterium]